MATALFAIDRVGDTVIVTPRADLGEVEYQLVEPEAKQVLALVNDPSVRNIVLDFQQTTYYGSSALAFFVRLWKKVSTRNGRMAFCNLSPSEREILRLTRLDSLWPICGSREAALRAVAAP